ncbi:MAG: porin [Bdellovibrionota bacterium]
MKNVNLKRSQWLGVAVGLSAACMAAPAFAADGKVYYDEGTVIETHDFNTKINFLISPNFTYTDYDNGGRRDVGVDSNGDTTSFDVNQVRVNFQGDLLGKQFSYDIYHDLRSDGGGSELQDAWLQYNSDQVNLRWGQFYVPFSRQEIETDYGQQMLDRSFVADRFAPGRQMGAMAHGPIADGLTYAAGLFNGVEGQNHAGQDNKLLYVAQVTGSTPNYGSRATEGDLRKDNSSLDMTGGVAAYYTEGDVKAFDADVELFGLNADFGLKASGFSLQTEFYYENADLKDSGTGSLDNFGFYVQGGYLLDKNWEVATRFGYYEPDNDLADEDIESYELVANYFINGHALKLQTGVAWLVDNVGDNDTTDFQFETRLTGWL